MRKDLTPGDDMLEFLRRKFSTPARGLGEVPQMDLQEAVRRLAEVVLAGCGQRPGVGTPELEALQYAAAAMALSGQEIDRSQLVVLTIAEAEELARRCGDYTLQQRCATTRALGDIGKGLHTAQWTRGGKPIPTPALPGAGARALPPGQRNALPAPENTDDD